MRRLLRLVWLIALVTLLVGCDSQAAASPVSTNQVDMPPSYLFSPVAIQVPVGTTVTWHNSDNFTHSVRMLDAANVNKVAHPGESVSITFATPGQYRYDCAFHPQQMHGTVEVVAR